MRFWITVGLAGCSGPDEPACAGWDEVFVYTDSDADGFGADPVGWVCTPDTNHAVTAGDCDDGDPTSFPGAEERCDTVDNDCDGRPDDGLALVTWYEDADGDTFGRRASEPTCAPPKPGWVARAGDCDDNDPDVNPLVREVCNGIDDDCDRRTDDEDDGVDPTTRTSWFPDADSDGWGAADQAVEACSIPDPSWVARGGDCHDTRHTANPEGSETCNGVDDDCDTLPAWPTFGGLVYVPDPPN